MLMKYNLNSSRCRIIVILSFLTLLLLWLYTHFVSTGFSGIKIFRLKNSTNVLILNSNGSKEISSHPFQRFTPSIISSLKTIYGTYENQSTKRTSVGTVTRKEMYTSSTAKTISMSTRKQEKQYLSTSTIKNPFENYFHPTMSSLQRTKMLELLKVFKLQMEKYNITYLLYGGSLIGAYRHHGFIPWDDDIDLLVDSKQKELLKTSLKELNKTHNLIHYGGQETGKWKFFKLDGKPYSHKPFRYPYLDIFFLREYNKTMFKVEIEWYLIRKSDMFPMINKPFDGIMLPTPCNTKNALEIYYGNLDTCSSASWNHSTEYGIPYSRRKTVDCNKLKPFFPFVQRKIVKLDDRYNVTEVLVKDNRVIQTVNYFTPLFCSSNYSSYDWNSPTIKTPLS